MTLRSAIRSARKACEAMRPRMMVSADAQRHMITLDDYYYTENPHARNVDDERWAAAHYWMYGCYLTAVDGQPAYDGGIHFYGDANVRRGE